MNFLELDCAYMQKFLHGMQLFSIIEMWGIHIHTYNMNICIHIELTLEQHMFELCGSTYGLFFNKYMGKDFGNLCHFEKHFLFSNLHYCKNVIYHTYNMQNMC